MTDQHDAPWYDDLTDTDKVEYHRHYLQLLDDLREMTDVLDMTAQRRMFPIRTYTPEVTISFFVPTNEGAVDPQTTFDAVAAFVEAAGGKVEHRKTRAGDVHHVAELLFGSGRASYRATWIERP